MYVSGAQPDLRFGGGGSFHEISFDDVIVLRAYSTMVQKFCKITPKMRIFVHSGSKF